MNIRMKNLSQYVLPTILGNCAYFLFTIIDGIFVGQGVGTDALGAVNLVWPFVMVLNAFVMLTVVGGVTVSAVRIGRGDITGANQAFMHSLAGTLTVAVVMMLVGTCLTSEIATLLGANETYHRLVCDYLFWYSLFAVPSGMMTFLNNYCRNDGSPVLVSVASIVSTVINIFLDWLFVFPLQKGLMGAAVATGISQTCGMLIVSSHFFLRRGRLRVGRFRFSGALVRKLLLRGTPEAIAQFAVPVATLCTNYVLLARLGDMAVNAYSIICYVASFSAAVFIGVSCGLQPLFGQSYGARDAQDLKWYFRAGVLIDLIGSALINIVLLFGRRADLPNVRRGRPDACLHRGIYAALCVGLHHHEREYAYISLPVFDQAHEAGSHFESVPQLPAGQRDHLCRTGCFWRQCRLADHGHL